MRNDYILGDAFVELAKLEDKSVDLVFTSIADFSESKSADVDDYQGFRSKALNELARIVKDSGFVVTCQTDRKINAQIMPNHISDYNTMIGLGFKLKDYKIIVRNKIESKNMYRFNYQHMNIFTKTGTIKRSGDWLRDILVYQSNMREKQYVWNEDFVKLTLEYLSKEGDFVVDPFAGAGIVPYICKRMKRECLATEIVPEIYNENYEIFESNNGFIG